MAKANRGGKRTTMTAVNTAQSQPVQFSQKVEQAVQQLVDDGTIDGALGGNLTRDAFLKMDEDERANVILTAMTEDVPDFLSTSSLQRFAYATGMDKMPTLVDDATFKSLSGTQLYRTVNSTYDRSNDVNYTSKEIAEQIQMGDYTRYSDNGGSAYGRGLYFADDFGGSRAYGRSTGKSSMVSAKINAGAKVISYSSAVSGANNEILNGTKLGKVLAKADYASQSSLYAVAKGYQIVKDNRSGYHVVLDRSAITVSKRIIDPYQHRSW